MVELKYNKTQDPCLRFTYDLKPGCGCGWDEYDFYKKWFGLLCALHLIGTKPNRRVIRNISNCTFDIVYGFEYYNSHLDDIHEIRTSKPSRQGRPMHEAYFKYPSKEGVTNKCQYHNRHFHGIISEGKIVGYIISCRMGDIAKTITIIGHGDYLKYGMMHKLLHEVISFYGLPFVYGNWNSGVDGLRMFKYHNGFRPAQITVA